jgi:hypothetical protein
MITKGIRIS